MSLALIDILGDEPIDHEDAKRHARVIAGADDTQIRAMITAARQLCEAYTGRAIIRARYKQRLAKFPSCQPIVLDKPPLIAVESIEYVDTAGAVATVATADYKVSTYGDPGRIVLAMGKSWPSVRSFAAEPVTVTFTAGYTDPPESIKHAVRLLVAHWYDNREAVVSGKAATTLPLAVENLLNTVTWETYR
ncbi:MAG: head-tail connector protein [Planctomycetota bacterium]